jgi:hypothetical protein
MNYFMDMIYENYDSNDYGYFCDPDPSFKVKYNNKLYYKPNIPTISEDTYEYDEESCEYNSKYDKTNNVNSIFVNVLSYITVSVLSIMSVQTIFNWQENDK